jgi:hypothetical protein
MMYTSLPLDIHIIGDEIAHAHIDSLLQLVRTPSHPIHVTYYPISETALEARLDRTSRPTGKYPEYGKIDTNHYGGKGRSAVGVRSALTAALQLD